LEGGYQVYHKGWGNIKRECVRIPFRLLEISNVFIINIKVAVYPVVFPTESFEAIGGVPKTILVDNMKTVMDESRTAHKPGVVNERFYQFSKDFGFDVQPCVAYSPRTKGKVEAPMKILDEIHAYQGKFTYEELHQFIHELCDRVNHEYHKGTGKI